MVHGEGGCSAPVMVKVHGEGVQCTCGGHSSLYVWWSGHGPVYLWWSKCTVCVVVWCSIPVVYMVHGEGVQCTCGSQGAW